MAGRFDTRTELKTPVLTSVLEPSKGLTSQDLLDVNHPVNNKAISGKREGMGVMIDGVGYIATGSKAADGWNGMGGDSVLQRHFSFNEASNIMELDVALSTTLSTIWLSDQWGFKSGGKSVFFSSTDQDTNFSPIMRGIKNQAVPNNQGIGGIIPPFYRKYSDRLLRSSLLGTMSTTESEVTPYEGISTLTTDVAVFGVRAVLGESLKEGDRLWYRLWDGTTDEGSKIFEQSLTVTEDREAGFDFIGWWSAPAEGFNTEQVFARITVEPADGSPTRTVLVRATAENPNQHWNELQFRTFIDYEVKLGNRVSRALVFHEGPYLASIQTVAEMLPTEGSRVVDIDFTRMAEGEEYSFRLKFNVKEWTQSRSVGFKIVPTSYLEDPLVPFHFQADGVSQWSIQPPEGTGPDSEHIIIEYKFSVSAGVVKYSITSVGLVEALNISMPAGGYPAYLVANHPRLTIWSHHGATGVKAGEIEVVSNT